MTIHLVGDGAILLDGDVAEADNQRLDRFDGHVLFVERAERVAGHRRRTSRLLLLLSGRFTLLASLDDPSFESTLDNDGLMINT